MMATMAQHMEEQSISLALEDMSGCYADELEAFMKCLEESAMAPCCMLSPEEDLVSDELSIVRSRDKADSVSSDVSSSSASYASGEDSSTSCPEQSLEEEEDEDEDEEDDEVQEKQVKKEEEVNNMLIEPLDVDQTQKQKRSDKALPPGAPSGHTMVMRKRTCKDYDLRNSSLINRIKTEERVEQRVRTPRKHKPKITPPPLSKYRRRTANSRERSRMRDINDAFEVLRKAIPSYPTEQNGVKLTKITTLRLALSYIATLRDMLGYEGANITEPNTVPLPGATPSFTNTTNTTIPILPALPPVATETTSLSPTLNPKHYQHHPAVNNNQSTCSKLTINSVDPNVLYSMTPPWSNSSSTTITHHRNDHPCFSLLDTTEDESIIS